MALLPAVAAATLVLSVAAYLSADRVGCSTIARLRRLGSAETNCDDGSLVDVGNWTVSFAELRAALLAGKVPYLRGGVPKIMHQTWPTRQMGPSHAAWVHSWSTMEPGWLHVLWTDEDLRRFITEEHPTVLELFDSYPRVIMQTDLARAYILWSYGGVYADTDFQALADIGPSVEGKGVCLVGSPWKEWEDVENSLMSSRPGHPFWPVVFDLFREHRPGALGRNDDPLKATGPALLGEAMRRYAAKAPDDVIRLGEDRFMFGKATPEGPAVSAHHFAHRWFEEGTREDLKFFARIGFVLSLAGLAFSVHRQRREAACPSPGECGDDARQPLAAWGDAGWGGPTAYRAL